MTARRIIGVGSPFGADTVGWEVTERLESRCASRPELEFLRLDRPGTGLLELLDGASAVLIIDAMRAGLAPGTLRPLTLAALEAESPLLSSHGLGVAQALALGQSLGQLPSRLSIIGIEIGEGVIPFEPAVIVRMAESIAREHL